MSYISVYSNYKDKNSDILVWERTESGERICKSYSPPYYFFVQAEEDYEGELFTSIYKHRLKKLKFENYFDFAEAKKQFKLKFESDFSAADRILMDNYFEAPIPKLKFSLYDIEVDVGNNADKIERFPSASKAEEPINAFTIYNEWEDMYYHVSIPPEEWDGQEIIPDFKELGYEEIPNLEMLFVKNELELLSIFLDLLSECDLFTGWNSEIFDLTFIYQRIKKLFGENETSRLCFPGTDVPSIKMKEHFGKEEMTIQLNGRIHLDYMEVFKKFTYEGRSSWSLDSICEEELGLNKLEYTGSLRDLYHNDFKHFVAYSIIDVYLLVKLEKAKNFIVLTNQMAHENTVPLPAIMGTTKYVDIGTRNHSFYRMNMVTKDKEVAVKHDPVEGAIVMTPNIGLHKLVGSIDIKSLYPSVIRSLNISPEKIVGYFETIETIEYCMSLSSTQDIQQKARKKGTDISSFFLAMSKEYDWRGITAKDNRVHTLHFLNGNVLQKTGSEWYDFLHEQKWSISGYGVVFDQSSGQGVVASVLTYWYEERVRLQAEQEKWAKKKEQLLKQFVTID